MFKLLILLLLLIIAITLIGGLFARVSGHGQPAVPYMSAEEYRRLRRSRVQTWAWRIAIGFLLIGLTVAAYHFGAMSAAGR